MTRLVSCALCCVLGTKVAFADTHTAFDLQDFFQRSQTFGAIEGLQDSAPDEFRTGEHIISTYNSVDLNWLSSDFFRRNGYDLGIPVTHAGQVELVQSRPETALFAIAGAFWSVAPQSLLPSNYFLVETSFYSYELSDLDDDGRASFATPDFNDLSLSPILMTVEPVGASARYNRQSFDPPRQARVLTDGRSREASEAEQAENAFSMESCSAAVTELRKPRRTSSGDTWNYIDDFGSGCLNMDSAGNLRSMNRDALLHLGQCWDAYANFDQFCYDGWPEPNNLRDISGLTGGLFIASEKGIMFRCSATILTQDTIATAAHCLDGWNGDQIDVNGDYWNLFFTGGPNRPRMSFALRDILSSPELLKDVFPLVVDVQFSEFWDWQNAGSDILPEFEPVVLRLSRSVMGTGNWIEDVVQPEMHQPLVVSSMSLFAMRLAQLKARLEDKRQPIHADFLVGNSWQRLVRTDNSPICIAGALGVGAIPTIGHDCQTNRGSSGSLLFLRQDDRLSVLGMHVGAPGRALDEPEERGPNNLGTSLSDNAKAAVQ